MPTLTNPETGETKEISMEEFMKMMRDGNGSIQQVVKHADGSSTSTTLYGNITADGLDYSINIFTNITTFNAFFARKIKKLVGEIEDTSPATNSDDLFEITVDFTDAAIMGILRRTEEELSVAIYTRDERKSTSEMLRSAYKSWKVKPDHSFEFNGEDLQNENQRAASSMLAFMEMRDFLRTEGKLEELKKLGNRGSGVILEATGQADDAKATIVRGRNRPDLPCNMFLLGEQMMRPYIDEMMRDAMMTGMSLEEKIEAAEGGDPDMMEHLAQMYLNGDGEVAQDFEKSAYWWKKLAETGNAIGQFNTGLHYAKGCGVKRDFAKAAEWMKKSAENGDEEAIGVAELYAGAAEKLKKAEAGDAAAQADIAKLFTQIGGSLNQFGSQNDYADSFKWAKKAADQGNPDGMYCLGLCYEHGRGTALSKEKAADTYEKAAKLGHAPSQWNLAVCYLNGSGRERNEVKGYMWAYQAADQKYDLAVNGLTHLGRTIGQIIEFHKIPDNSKTLEGTQYNGRAERCESFRPGTKLTYKITKDKNGDDVIEIFSPKGSVGVLAKWGCAEILALLKLDRINLAVTVKSCIPKSKRGTRARNADVSLNLIISEKKPETPEERAKRLAEEEERRIAEEKRKEEERKESCYSEALEDMNSSDEALIKKAIKSFTSLQDYRDSKEKVATCKDKLKKIQEENERKRLKKEAEEKERLYKEALKNMDSSREAAVNKAIGIFTSLKDYRDSKEKIAFCKDKLKKIQEENERKRLEGLRKSEEERQKKEAEKERQRQLEEEKARLKQEKQKKLMIIGAAVAALIMAVYLLITGYIIPHGTYTQAEELLAKGEKAEAAMMFATVSNFSDARERSFALWDEIANRKALDAGGHIYVGRGKFGAITQNGNTFVFDAEDRLTAPSDGDYISVAAGADVIRFLKSNGTVTGKPEWKDIVDIEAGIDGTLFGLKADGTVIADSITENNRNFNTKEIKEWSGIIDLAVGPQFLLGLKADGTVVASAFRTNHENYYNELDVDSWNDIVKIAAGSDLSIGLKTDGTVVATGSDYYHAVSYASTWTDIVDISAYRKIIAGLRSDGTVLIAGCEGDNNNGEREATEWTDIVMMETGFAFIAGVKADGTILTAGELFNTPENWPDLGPVAYDTDIFDFNMAETSTPDLSTTDAASSDLTSADATTSDSVTSDVIGSDSTTLESSASELTTSDSTTTATATADSVASDSTTTAAVTSESAATE